MRTENMNGVIKIVNVFPDEQLLKYKKMELAENISLMLEAFSKANDIKTIAKVS